MRGRRGERRRRRRGIRRERLFGCSLGGERTNRKARSGRRAEDGRRGRDLVFIGVRISG